jgi:hypothetical protein
MFCFEREEKQIYTMEMNDSFVFFTNELLIFNDI